MVSLVNYFWETLKDRCNLPHAAWQRVLSSVLANCEAIKEKSPAFVDDCDITLKYVAYIDATFTCLRWRCRTSWESTQVPVEFTYGYSHADKSGSIQIREYGQSCSLCSAGMRQWSPPKFTRESMNDAAKSLLAKILENFYGIQSDVLEDTRSSKSAQHELDKAKDCQACEEGKCWQPDSPDRHNEDMNPEFHLKGAPGADPVVWYFIIPEKMMNKKMRLGDDSASLVRIVLTGATIVALFTMSRMTYNYRKVKREQGFPCHPSTSCSHGCTGCMMTCQ